MTEKTARTQSDIRLSAPLEAFLRVQRELPHATPQKQMERFSEIVESNPALQRRFSAGAPLDILRELKEEEEDDD